MYSYCCNALVCLPGANSDSFDKHVLLDWYECSHCARPCDRMSQTPRKGQNNDEFKFPHLV